MYGVFFVVGGGGGGYIFLRPPKLYGEAIKIV